MDKNGGMQDIGSMSMNVPQQGNSRIMGNSNMQIPNNGDKKVFFVAVAAVLVLLVIIFGVSRISSGKEKKTDIAEVEEESIGMDQAMEAAQVWGQFMSGKISPSDMQWNRYYPDEVAEIFEREMSDIDYMDDAAATVNIVGMVEINGTKNISLLKDMVSEFSDDIDISLRNTDVAEGYMVLYYLEGNGEELFMWGMIVEVNGRYGIYGMDSL